MSSGRVARLSKRPASTFRHSRERGNPRRNAHHRPQSHPSSDPRLGSGSPLRSGRNDGSTSGRPTRPSHVLCSPGVHAWGAGPLRAIHGPFPPKAVLGPAHGPLVDLRLLVVKDEDVVFWETPVLHQQLLDCRQVVSTMGQLPQPPVGIGIRAKNEGVATSAARQRALRSLPRVTHNYPCHDDEDRETGSRVKH